MATWSAGWSGQRMGIALFPFVNLMLWLVTLGLITLGLATPALAQEAVEQRRDARAQAIAAEQDKAAEDPTKISTRVGIAYASELSTSGSIAVGPRFKFNGRIAKSGQWSLGASYLFPVAILTLTAGKSELDTGVKQSRYSLGGFVPLSQIGLDTGKWMLFVPFGYSHTTSQQPVTDLDQQDGIPITVSADSAYAGLFVLRPLGPRLTAMGGTNYTRGTHGYSGLAAAGGLSYHVTARDTVAVRVSYITNTYGTKSRLGLSYQHEF